MNMGSARRQITSSMSGLLMAARPSAASHVAMATPKVAELPTASPSSDTN